MTSSGSSGVINTAYRKPARFPQWRDTITQMATSAAALMATSIRPKLSMPWLMLPIARISASATTGYSTGKSV